MDRATTIARYPYMAQLIVSQPPESQPDFPGIGAGERLLWLTGALARTLLAAIFAAIAFAILLVILVSLAKGASMSPAGSALTHASALIQPAPASCPAGVPVQTITVVNQANVRPVALARAENAVTDQSMQLRAAWGTPCVQFGPGGWSVYLQIGNAEWGVHYTEPVRAVVYTAGLPMLAWSQAFSHEIVEMLVDPSTTNSYMANNATAGVVEVADPVGERAYRLGGVWVTDFVFPSWYAGGEYGLCETSGAVVNGEWTNSQRCEGPLIAPASAPAPYDEMGILSAAWDAKWERPDTMFGNP